AVTASLQFLMTANGDEIANDPNVRAMLTVLLRDNRCGFRGGESAAFILRDESGRFSRIVWPATDEPNSAQWNGTLPARAVAIVHTHPCWLSMPSHIDR